MLRTPACKSTGQIYKESRWASEGVREGGGVGEGGGGATSGRRGHLDVSIKCVGSKNGASALVSLSLVLFKGGHVAGVSVGQASNGYGDISPRRLHLYKASLRSHTIDRMCTSCCLS